MARRVPWKLLGVAGLGGVAATGVVLARRRREPTVTDPDELRARLHERLRASGQAAAAAPPTPSRDGYGREVRPHPSLDGPGAQQGGAESGGRVAVTGATGALGGLIVRELGGTPLTLVVRDAARAPDAAADVRVAEVPGGYDDRAGLAAALHGVATLVLVPAAEHPDRVQQHRNVIDAAKDAGVAHVLYVSFVGAAPDATFTLARDHFATEEHLKASGLRWTVLRMGMYADFLGALVQDGVIRGPAGDGRFAPVFREDVARAAATIARDPAPHAARTYTATGPRCTTMAEVAEHLGATYVQETLDEARASRAHLAEPWEVEGWVTSYAAIAAGELDVVSDDVQRLTGAQAIDFTA